MAQGDVIWDDASGRDRAVVEVPTATPTDGVAKADGVVILSAAGVATTPPSSVTEDAAAAANPAGPVLMGVAITTLANEVPDGDYVAARYSRRGEQYVAGPMTSAEFLANLRSTAAFTTVASTNVSTTILAANANRKGAVIVNTDANILYLDLSGGTAATTRYAAALSTGEEYEVPFGLTGLITGIWAADGAGSALVTEFS